MDPEHNKDEVRDVFKQMYANPAFLSDILVDYFIGLMRDQGAKKAFKTAFDDTLLDQSV